MKWEGMAYCIAVCNVMRNSGILEHQGDETHWIKVKNTGLKLHFESHVRIEFGEPG